MEKEIVTSTDYDRIVKKLSARYCDAIDKIHKTKSPATFVNEVFELLPTRFLKSMQKISSKTIITSDQMKSDFLKLTKDMEPKNVFRILCEMLSSAIAQSVALSILAPTLPPRNKVDVTPSATTTTTSIIDLPPELLDEVSTYLTGKDFINFVAATSVLSTQMKTSFDNIKGQTDASFAFWTLLHGLKWQLTFDIGSGNVGTLIIEIDKDFPNIPKLTVTFKREGEGKYELSTDPSRNFSVAIILYLNEMFNVEGFKRKMNLGLVESVYEKDLSIPPTRSMEDLDYILSLYRKRDNNQSLTDDRPELSNIKFLEKLLRFFIKDTSRRDSKCQVHITKTRKCLLRPYFLFKKEERKTPRPTLQQELLYVINQDFRNPGSPICANATEAFGSVDFEKYILLPLWMNNDDMGAFDEINCLTIGNAIPKLIHSDKIKALLELQLFWLDCFQILTTNIKAKCSSPCEFRFPLKRLLTMSSDARSLRSVNVKFPLLRKVLGFPTGPLCFQPIPDTDKWDYGDRLDLLLVEWFNIGLGNSSRLNTFRYPELLEKFFLLSKGNYDYERIDDEEGQTFTTQKGWQKKEEDK